MPNNNETEMLKTYKDKLERRQQQFKAALDKTVELREAKREAKKDMTSEMLAQVKCTHKRRKKRKEITTDHCTKCILRFAEQSLEEKWSPEQCYNNAKEHCMIVLRYFASQQPDPGLNFPAPKL